MVTPLLDASKFRNGSPSERQEYAQQLLEQLQGSGFVRITNHGIPNDKVEECFEWVRLLRPSTTSYNDQLTPPQSKKFFALSLPERLKALNPPGPTPQRGWSTLGAEKTSTLYGKLMGHDLPEDLRDARQHFDMGTPGDTMFPTRWPSETAIPGFKPYLETFFFLCEAVSLEILEALELALGVPEATFRKHCTPNASEFRLNHYPALSVQELADEKVERIWPHFDLGVITLLFTDSVGGLQFEDRSRPGEFKTVDATAKSDLVVNISETLGRWTAEKIPAGLHRVTSPENAEESKVIPERYSIAYFCKAARQAKVAPLQPFRSAEEEKEVGESLTALEYQQKRLLTAY